MQGDTRLRHKQKKGQTKASAIGVVEGTMQVAVLALTAPAAYLVVLPLDVVVTEGTGIDVDGVLAGCPILHGVTSAGDHCHRAALPVICCRV